MFPTIFSHKPHLIAGTRSYQFNKKKSVKMAMNLFFFHAVISLNPVDPFKPGCEI